MRNDSESGKGFFSILLGIYIIISQFMAIYYWIEYVKEDNFFMAITIDVLLAELKGLFWIFFVW